MTEAVAALVAYCLGELAVHRIEALIHSDTLASIRLVERLGFRCEGGPLRDRWRRGEGYMSVMMYALIAGELPLHLSAEGRGERSGKRTVAWGARHLALPARDRPGARGRR